MIVPTLLIVILLTALGSEKHSADFGSQETSQAADIDPDRDAVSGRFTRERSPTAAAR